MCISLRDKDLRVRKNTLTMLIQLIQEDYLKLRCPLFFHILLMLNDDEEKIRSLTSSFILNSLLIKQKNVLVQHFVESLFHYNFYLVSVYLSTVRGKFYFTLCRLLKFGIGSSTTN